MASLTDTNDQLQGRMEESEKELEATRELYVELKDVTHRQVLRNLLDTKDLLRYSSTNSFAVSKFVTNELSFLIILF